MQPIIAPVTTTATARPHLLHATIMPAQLPPTAHVTQAHHLLHEAIPPCPAQQDIRVQARLRPHAIANTQGRRVHYLTKLPQIAPIAAVPTSVRAALQTATALHVLAHRRTAVTTAHRRATEVIPHRATTATLLRIVAILPLRRVVAGVAALRTAVVLRRRKTIRPRYVAAALRAVAARRQATVAVLRAVAAAPRTLRAAAMEAVDKNILSLKNITT